MTRRASPAKLRRKPALSLVASMPTISTSGRDTRSSRSASAAAIARPPSALWPPSSQSSLPARRQRRELPVRQSAACAPAIRPWRCRPRRPQRQRRARRRAAPRWRCRHCRTGGGRTSLRQRQVEQAVVVLIDQAAALLVHAPVLAGDVQRRAHARAPAARSPPARSSACGAIDRRHAALEDAGLLGGDLLRACRRETPGGRSRPA